MIPGSNRWGLVEEYSNFWSEDRKSQLDAMRERREDFQEPTSCVLKAGHASFHHCLTLHGSAPNLTVRPRRSLAVHLFAGDLLSAADPSLPRHYNSELLVQEGGHIGGPYVGRYWPRIYPPSSG